MKMYQLGSDYKNYGFDTNEVTIQQMAARCIEMCNENLNKYIEGELEFDVFMALKKQWLIILEAA